MKICFLKENTHFKEHNNTEFFLYEIIIVFIEYQNLLPHWKNRPENIEWFVLAKFQLSYNGYGQ